MTAQPILGIDPGAHGAIAALDGETGELISIEDMPSTTEANGRTATNAPLLAGLLARTHARIAFCVFAGARPTVAKVAAFAFGRRSRCHRRLRRRARPADRVPDAANMKAGRRHSAWRREQGPGANTVSRMTTSQKLRQPKPRGEATERIA
jgi:hypothetical protein